MKFYSFDKINKYFFPLFIIKSNKTSLTVFLWKKFNDKYTKLFNELKTPSKFQNLHNS